MRSPSRSMNILHPLGSRFASHAWVPRMLGIGFAVLVAAPPSWSCSCVRIQNWVEYAREVPFIFTGKVIAIKQPPVVKDTNGHILIRSDSPVQYTFQISKSLKGLTETREINIKSALHDASCGYSFQSDSSYLVFPYSVQEDSVLWTGLCTGTMPLNAAKAQGILDTVSSAAATSVRSRRSAKAVSAHSRSAPRFQPTPTQPCEFLGRKAKPDHRPR